MRIREFFSGGPGPTARKQSEQIVLFFLVLNLFYSLQRGSNGLITRGVQMLISIETNITCDFQGGGGSGPPIPPLDPHMLTVRT